PADKSRPLAARIYNFVPHLDGAFEHAADKTFLPPHVTLAQLSVSIKAGQLCAGAGATRRTVVRFSRAKNEILAIDTGDLRRRKQFDVIDLLSAIASNTRIVQGLPHRPCKSGQCLNIVQRHFQAMFLDKEEPIPTPGDITTYAAVAVDINGYLCSLAITGDVADRY